MRILLVGLNGVLFPAISEVLNQNHEYCAVVVDEVAPARNILSNYPAERIFPLYELKECVENFYYDCVVCVGDGYKLPEECKRCGVPKDKLVNLADLNTPRHFLLDRALRYFEKHSAEFEMFAVGASMLELGLMPKKFTKKLFNFSLLSQDLYFDYQISKFVISRGGAWDLLY